MTMVYLGLGSNLGNRKRMIVKALERLQANRLIVRIRLSPLYETDPLGYLPQPRFLNGVCELETELPPLALLNELRMIENFLGRVRTRVYGPRTLDLDLLDYGGQILKHDRLRIPHPRMHERAFVLKPLCDLNPRWMHPVFHRCAQGLLLNLGIRP